MKTTLFLLLILGLTAANGLCEERVWTIAKHLEVAGQQDGKTMAATQGEWYRFIQHDAGLTSSTIVLIATDGTNVTLNAASVSLHDYYGSDGKSGVERNRKSLSADQWRALKDQLAKLDFWHYQAKPIIGLDGSTWILEGAKDGVYRRIEEWSPDPGKFREPCLSMWRASGLFMGMYEKLTR